MSVDVLMSEEHGDQKGDEANGEARSAQRCRWVGSRGRAGLSDGADELEELDERENEQRACKSDPFEPLPVR